MLKRGHLTLVGGTSVDFAHLYRPSGPALTLVSPAQEQPKKPAVSPIKEMEQELLAMRDVTDAAISLMQLLPLSEMEEQELTDLYEMFTSGLQVLEAYDGELKRIRNGRMSPREMRQLARVRNLHNYLLEGIPEAANSIAGVLVKFDAEKNKPRSKKNRSKAALSAATIGQPNGVQLKVLLKGSKPPVWRRLRLPGDCTLAELHTAIQLSMGWKNGHGHSFVIDGQVLSSEEGEPNWNKHTLQDFALQAGTKFEYVHESAESWVHTVELERMLETPLDVLECTGGRRDCPTEGCGGIRAYNEMAASLRERGAEQAE